MKVLGLILLLLTIFLQVASAQEEKACESESMTTHTVLVVGATGATGKNVVQQLLDKGHSVRAVVRSKQRMFDLLKEDEASYGDRLSLTEAALLDLDDAQLQSLVKDTTAVVSCLGHNMNFKGMWGKPRRLVTDATRRLTAAIQGTSTKFILMGSDGVANPSGSDDERTTTERSILWLLRHTLPPHADNEEAAATIHATKGVEWTVIRPTDLIDGEATEYTLYNKPQGSLFGSGTATRANVAKCMVDMILDDKLWEEYKYQMPVLHDKATPEGAAK